MKLQLLGISILLFGILFAVIDDGHIGYHFGFISLWVGAIVSLAGFFHNEKRSEKNNEDAKK